MWENDFEIGVKSLLAVVMNNVAKCPVRDKILVENEIFNTRSYRPVRDGILVEIIFPQSRRISCQFQHCVPNGTPEFA